LAPGAAGIDRKFRFRALEAAWQSRNAGLFSGFSGSRMPGKSRYCHDIGPACG
jgi:hypothetical protein